MPGNHFILRYLRDKIIGSGGKPETGRRTSQLMDVMVSGSGSDDGHRQSSADIKFALKVAKNIQYQLNFYYIAYSFTLECFYICGIYMYVFIVEKLD